MAVGIGSIFRSLRRPNPRTGFHACDGSVGSQESTALSGLRNKVDTGGAGALATTFALAPS